MIAAVPASPSALPCSRILRAVRCRPTGSLAGRRIAVPQPPQLIEDRVEPLPSDELHRVIRHAILFTHGEDRHDVRVVQTGGRAGLAAETAELDRVEPAVWRQDLERDVPAERFLDRFVDNAHAAPAEYAQDPEIT